MKNTKLTSVKILEDLYKRFKLMTVNTKMSLQKLTNRSIDLYLTDEKFKLSTVNNSMTLQKLTNRSIQLFLEDNKFKDTIENNDNLKISGSHF